MSAVKIRARGACRLCGSLTYIRMELAGKLSHICEKCIRRTWAPEVSDLAPKRPRGDSCPKLSP